MSSSQRASESLENEARLRMKLDTVVPQAKAIESFRVGARPRYDAPACETDRLRETYLPMTRPWGTDRTRATKRRGCMLKNIVKGALVASAVAGLFAANTAHAKGDKEKAKAVKCSGVNDCKGKGACAGADNACKGKNAC